MFKKKSILKFEIINYYYYNDTWNHSAFFHMNGQTITNLFQY